MAEVCPGFGVEGRGHVGERLNTIVHVRLEKVCAVTWMIDVGIYRQM